MNVAVIGGSNCTKKNYNIAKELGCLIALEGWTLICGGGFGVMEAACKGAKEKGGLTVGILPSYKGEDANSYLDVQIPTGLGYARNILVVRSAEIVIAIDGKEGTLSEIAFALNEKKYVIGINTWDIKGIKKVSTVQQAIEKIKAKLLNLNN
ncbi:MAG: TIGR00725 family protein [Candidatus Omnitrophica bacterium]|nr:TIGR00725 family protein [Candidatus Omnitrophota bacterium]